MRRTLAVATLLLAACATGHQPPEVDEATARSGLVVHEAAPLEAVELTALTQKEGLPAGEVTVAGPAADQAIGAAGPGTFEPAPHSITKQVLASLTITSSTCDLWNPGDSAMIAAWLEIQGDAVTIDLGMYPILTGTLDEGEVVLSGFMASLESEPNTSCTVEGGGTVDGSTIVGHLSETLEGDTNCTTKVHFSL